MNSYKVVLICHYFPPHNNCGVRRVLYWANSLANKGHDVTVLTSKKTKYKLRPEGLHQKVKIVDFSFGRLRKLEVGAMQSFDFSAQSNEVWWKRIALKIKRKLLNPNFGQLADPNLPSVIATIFTIWLRGRITSKNSKIDFKDATIISTAPPWSMHLLGCALSIIFRRPLLVDYRDQFSNNHMFGGYLGWLEYKIDNYLCKRASKVITISPSMRSYYSNFNTSTELLMNGYDPSLFWANDNSFKLSSPIKIRYFGTIQHATRLPILLLEALQETSTNVNLDFYGDVPLITEYLIENPQLKNIVTINKGVPVAEVRALMANSDFNLMCETMLGNSLSHTGVMTTKLFEYLAVERPVLALISPSSDMVSALSESGLLNGPFQTKLEVLDWLNTLKDSNFKFAPNQKHIQKFSRETSVGLLIDILDDLNEN